MTHVDGLDVVAEQLLDLLALNRGVDNDVLAGLPVAATMSAGILRPPRNAGQPRARGGSVRDVAICRVFGRRTYAGVVICHIVSFALRLSRRYASRLTLYLSPSCSESMTRNNSGKLRPVLAG